jgi:hypothetical protein
MDDGVAAPTAIAAGVATFGNRRNLVLVAGAAVGRLPPIINQTHEGHGRAGRSRCTQAGANESWRRSDRSITRNDRRWAAEIEPEAKSCYPPRPQLTSQDRRWLTIRCPKHPETARAQDIVCSSVVCLPLIRKDQRWLAQPKRAHCGRGPRRPLRTNIKTTLHTLAPGDADVYCCGCRAVAPNPGHLVSPSGLWAFGEA